MDKDRLGGPEGGGNERVFTCVQAYEFGVLDALQERSAAYYCHLFCFCYAECARFVFVPNLVIFLANFKFNQKSALFSLWKL